MKIREFKFDDLEQVSGLLNNYRIFYGKESDIESCTKFIKDRYVSNESKIFVADNGEELVGFVQIYPVFSTVSLQRAYILNDLYVSSNSRTGGVGRQLIEKTFEYARKNNARYVTLETGIDNTKAQSLYKKMDMKVDDSVLHFSRTFDINEI
ncbi:GNAT family N-acetyltransferase [Macrococcus epidermidis]|uniref:GNAT family N-acetyltransferase n=1 Tax=Macrococcus epidermidis TaxID=1902580 RepID=A0A327ZP24_9STAP|nr:GNAT family N-acetyltransferase [Macrococcus epidermidis]RAK43986.1 GNAT family N-acetyltransferase [Macrococcus epidermidis]